MAITLEQLNIKIVGNSTDASASVDKLAASLRNLRGEAKEMASYGNAVNSAIRGMNKAAGGKEGAGLVGKHYRQVKEEATAAASAIDSVSQATSSTQTETKAAASAQKQYNSDLKQTKTAAGQAAKAVKETGDAATKSSSKFGDFMRSIGRIAKYRAIRFAIREITQAVVEGTQAFIEWDRANGDVAGAAKAVDELKAAWNEVKGAIGAAAGAVITLLKPVIEFIADVVIQIVNGIQMIIRGLKGETTWFRYVRKEATATTAAAKELKRVLFGFDELNVLPSQNGGGTTSGGFGDYVEEEIPDWLQGIYGFFDNLKTKGDDTSKELQKDFSESAEKAGQKARKEAKDTGTATRTIFGEVIGGAELDIKKLNDYVHKNPITIPVNANVPITTIQTSIATAAEYAKKNPAEIKFGADAMSAALAGAAGASYASAAASFAAPVIVKTQLDSSGATDALNSWMSEAQTYLGKHPLKVFIKQVSSESSVSNPVPAFTPTPVVAPKTASNPITAGAGGGGRVSFLDERKSLSPVSSGSGASAFIPSALPNPYANMSATDLVNLAESEGLHLTSKDKETLAYTIGGILGAPVAGGLASLLGGLPAGVLAALEALGLIGAYANGGTPDMGTLFYAGENGAEVVANMGNHQSGVLNVMQMQAAMEGANEGVVGAVMAMSNAVVNAIRNKDTNVYMDGEVISRKVTRSQNNTARRFGEVTV